MNMFKTILLGILLTVAAKASGQGYVIDSVCQDAERYYRIDGEMGSTYTWVLTDPMGNSINLPETADTVTIIWNLGAGDYILSTLQTSIHGCDSLELGVIKVFGIPFAYAGESITRCGMSPFILDEASASGYSHLVWSSSGDGSFSDSTTVNPSYSFGPTDILLGTATLTLIAEGFGMEGSCPAAESSFTITLLDEVIPTFALINPICHSSIPPALQTISTNGLHGQWNPSEINTEFVGTTNYIFTPDTSICPVSITMPITIFNEITPVFATIGPLCPGSTAPLLSDTSLNGFTGNWFPSTINTTTQGITIYSFTSYSGQCASSATLAVEVSKPDIIGIQTITATNGLSNGIAKITAGGTAPPFVYSLNGSDWQVSNSYDTLVAGSYTAWVKDANGCTATKPFVIKNTVTGDVGVLANTVVSCLSLPIAIPVMAYDFTNIASFTIRLAFDSSVLDFTGLTNINTNLNGGSLTFTLVSPGILQITFNTSDSVTLLSEDRLFNLNFYGMASGYTDLEWSLQICAVYSVVGYEIPSIYTNGSIEVRPAPQIYTDGNGQYCEGTPLMLSAQSLTGQNLTYKWIGPLGGKHNGSQWDLGLLSLSDSGVYQVTGTDSTACAKTENVQLMVVPNPIVKLSEYDMLCSEQVIVLNAGSGFVDYVWQDGSKNPQLTAGNEGIYWVIVTDSNTCKASDSVLLRPCELLIWMPTAFSPNGDELNDIFIPKYNLDLVFDFKMLVFNKWGEEIFSSSDIKKGWDGTFKGVPCPPDMYTWTISFAAPPTYNFLQKSPQSGLVMLLK